MKVLMISTDRNIFNPESAVYQRVLAYSEKVEHLSVVVFSLKRHKLERIIISKQLMINPTNSLNRWLYVFGALYVAYRDVLSENGSGVDLITTQDPFETGIVGLLLSKWFSKRLQVQVHTDVVSPYFKKTSLLNRFRTTLAHIVIPHVNGVRTVSEKIKTSLQSTFSFRAPVSVLPVFVDQSRFSHRKEDHEFLRSKYPGFELFIILVGRLEFEKNISFALDLFKEIADQYPKLALVVIGDGSERMALQRKASSLGIGERVKFEGWVDNPSVYFQGADIFLHTSFYEGYGMTLLEARIAGLPVVTSDVGIARELKGEGVGVCEVGDKKCFLSYLEQFLNQQDLRLRVHLNTESYIEGMFISKEEYVKRYIALWEVALKAGW